MEKTYETYIKALNIASKAHRGQYRKGTDIPYITHPISVAQLVHRYCPKEGLNHLDVYQIMAVAILHDILEDVPPEIYSRENMKEDFGDQITHYVVALSEPKTAGQPELPWHDRKEQYIEQISFAPEAVQLVSACDKLDNLNAILTDYEQLGDELWERFGVTPQEEHDFYHRCWEVLTKIPFELRYDYSVRRKQMEEILP